jgi:PTS system cellobiose-specific IIA component
MSESLAKFAMDMIIHGGDAKGDAFDALRMARKGDFTKAEDFMALADKKMAECQRVHLKLLGIDLQFQSINEQLLVMHAMDTMMSTISQMDLIREIIAILQENLKIVSTPEE